MFVSFDLKYVSLKILCDYCYLDDLFHNTDAITNKMADVGFGS